MVNFDESMNISKEYREKIPSDKWDKLKKLYKNIVTYEEEKIPKKIHLLQSSFVYYID